MGLHGVNGACYMVCLVSEEGCMGYNLERTGLLRAL